MTLLKPIVLKYFDIKLKKDNTFYYYYNHGWLFKVTGNQIKPNMLPSNYEKQTL